MATEDEIARAIAENVLGSSSLSTEDKGEILADIARRAVGRAQARTEESDVDYEKLDPVGQFAHSFTHDNVPVAEPRKITRIISG